jgi:phosphate transport system ATP-binding protein
MHSGSELIIRPEGEIKIETRGLNVFYGGLHALKNVSIAIPSRRITALIGPSGCGKSSFLRSLDRMLELIEGAGVEGEVLLDGRSIYDKELDVALLRKRVGMVFQVPNPFPMSVYDNVAYGPRLHGAKGRETLDRVVEQSLRSAALWDEVKDKLRQSALDLSGGQQQRLCIARVLAVEPEVVLMDEPCSALDPAATFRIEELMLELVRQYTIVIVTHNMYQASRVSRYTGFFLMGELIEYGRTVDIFEHPQDRRTDDYVRGRFG